MTLDDWKAETTDALLEELVDTGKLGVMYDRDTTGFIVALQTDEQTFFEAKSTVSLRDALAELAFAVTEAHTP